MKDNGGCDIVPLAACTNQDGTVNCDCPSGYKGTGIGSTGCVDIDECAANNGNCDTSPMAICRNEQGATPTCTCPAGSSGNGVGSDGCRMNSVSGEACGKFICEANVVHDPSMTLLWQRSLPTTYGGCAGRYLPNEGVDGDACSWDEANAYCAQLVLNGMGWRLPVLAELESIRDVSRTAPSIDLAAFPNTLPRDFWSASAYPDEPTLAWRVSFENEREYFTDKIYDAAVRCVRKDTLP
jgi:hypothetical protein